MNMAISDSFQRAIASIPRRRRLLLGLGVQAAIPLASLYLALLLRLDLDASRIDHSIYWIWAAVLVMLRLAALGQFRAHTGLWRYVSVPDLLGITKATTASTIVLIPLLWLVSDFEGIPRTVPLIEWGVHIFLAGGLRIIVRVGRERLKASGQADRDRTRVLIVGAGDAGAAFCGQVLSTPDFLIKPIAFVDDNQAKTGQSLSGIPVIGASDQIPSAVEKMAIDRGVIAIPSATPEQRAQIVEYSRKAHVDFRILPGTDELLTGNVAISKLRRVDVSDLLGRPETQLDDQALRATFTGKTVLITGGAGPAVEQRLLAQPVDLAAPIYIVPNNPEWSAVSTAWLRRIQPRSAVLAGSRFNQITGRTDRITNAAIALYRVDRFGPVRVDLKTGAVVFLEP